MQNNYIIILFTPRTWGILLISQVAGFERRASLELENLKNLPTARKEIYIYLVFTNMPQYSNNKSYGLFIAFCASPAALVNALFGSCLSG